MIAMNQKPQKPLVHKDIGRLRKMLAALACGTGVAIVVLGTSHAIAAPMVAVL